MEVESAVAGGKPAVPDLLTCSTATCLNTWAAEFLPHLAAANLDAPSQTCTGRNGRMQRQSKQQVLGGLAHNHTHSFQQLQCVSATSCVFRCGLAHVVSVRACYSLQTSSTGCMNTGRNTNLQYVQDD